MLHHDLYVREKLREIEQRQPTLLSRRLPSAPRRAPVIGSAIRGTGHFLRRLGEGLEAIGGYEPQPARLERNPR